MSDRAVISVHASKETAERLDRIAEASGRSRSALANEAIERFIAEEEAWWAELARRVTETEKGEGKGFTTDELLERARLRYLKGASETAAE